MSKNETPTKVIVSCRFSYLHCWEPEAINGGEPKYSVSAIIPKSDKETIKKIQAAVEAAKQESLSKWGGKIPPNLKLPLRDGDIDRPEDEAYKGCYFFNANSRQAPQVVDKQVQPILDQTEVYSGCYGRISVNFYGYNSNGSPAFEILLFAYSFDDEETKIIDLAQGEQLTEEIKNALSDVGIIKTAFNANFERTCLSKYMGVRLSPESWVCTAVQSAMLALPLSLEGVGAVLGLSEQKLKEGKDLIRYFCVPCKPTKTNGGRSRNLPFHAPEKWKQFKTYCIRDVDVEKGIRQKLHKFPIPESEMAFYRLDQEINDRGVLVDRELVEQSITCDLLHKDIVTNRAYEVTGLENPNSVSQLKGWLSERGVEIDSLSKGAVAELIEDADGEVLEALKLRLLMAKTSVKKYEAIERSVCSDGRVHGFWN